MNEIDNLSLKIMDKEVSESELIDQINKVPDINATGKDGRSLLLHACVYGRLDIVKYLITKGANINHTDKNGNTTLHMAVMSLSANVEIVKLLLNNGVSVNAQNNLGNPPFWYIKGETLNIAKILLCNGADIHIKNNYNVSVFDFLKNIPEIKEFFATNGIV